MKCTNLLNAVKKIILQLSFCLILQFSNGQIPGFVKEQDTATAISVQKKSCNFYIFTPDADKKFDFLGNTALVRIYIKRIFIKKKLHVIVAKNSQQVAAKIIAILQDKEAMIGSLWFDSHGLYKQGYSSFHIGSDEFNYKNIHDSASITALKSLSSYSNTKTSIGIGSCYGGATFTFPGSASVSSGRMNGDSLMMGVGQIFYGATIYGSESWVMMKPGMFENNYGFAGYPLGKRYLTTYWKPVWDHLGKWNRYCSTTQKFECINTVALNNEGFIKVRARNYQQLKKGQKAIRKYLPRLKNYTKSKNYSSGV